jgi:hypothetical protein
MKIGFSLGRCIRDIVNGDVKYDDVAYIIAATAIRDIEQLKHVIDDYLYRRDYLEGLDEEQGMEVGLRLYTEGKVFQPRLQEIRAFRIPEGAVWADMFPTNMANNHSAKSAWEAYRFMLHMTVQVPEDVKENWKGRT